MRALLVASLAFVVLGCGGAPPPEPKAVEAPPPKVVKAEEPKAEPPKVAEMGPPSKEAEPEKCTAGWSCIKVPVEGARKVEKREHALIGDPKIPETWSKTIDDTKTAQFDFVKNRVIEITLKRKPNKKTDVILRTAAATSPDKKGAETVLDSHDTDDFTHVGLIAAEQDGQILIDISYRK